MSRVAGFQDLIKGGSVINTGAFKNEKIWQKIRHR